MKVKAFVISIVLLFLDIQLVFPQCFEMPTQQNTIYYLYNQTSSGKYFVRVVVFMFLARSHPTLNYFSDGQIYKDNWKNA